MLNVQGIDYTVDDFLRRYRHTYVRMNNGQVVYVDIADRNSVLVQKIKTSLYSGIELEQEVIPHERFDIMSNLPPVGYFNIASEEGYLRACNLRLKTHRQQVSGLSTARVQCDTTGTQLARAYDGYYVSLAEAVQCSLLTGRSVAVSRSFAVHGKDLLHMTGAAVGKIDPDRMEIVDIVRDEMNELLEQEGVRAW